MADATLKDVLVAIAQLRSEVAMKKDLTELATKKDVERLDAKIDAHRAETAKGFAELDRELTKHADVHREIEKDITTLKRRPPRTAARPARRR